MITKVRRAIRPLIKRFDLKEKEQAENATRRWRVGRKDEEEEATHLRATTRPRGACGRSPSWIRATPSWLSVVSAEVRRTGGTTTNLFFFFLVVTEEVCESGFDLRPIRARWTAKVTATSNAENRSNVRDKEHWHLTPAILSRPRRDWPPVPAFRAQTAAHQSADRALPPNPAIPALPVFSFPSARRPAGNIPKWIARGRGGRLADGESSQRPSMTPVVSRAFSRGCAMGASRTHCHREGINWLQPISCFATVIKIANLIGARFYRGLNLQACANRIKKNNLTQLTVATIK